jgi:hypothetical protein
MPPIEPLESDPVAMARHIIEFGATPEDFTPTHELGQRSGAPDEEAARIDLGLAWPAGLAPTPTPLATPPDTSASLPRCDYLVVTWTVAEADALADVLTPTHSRQKWYLYDRKFQEKYKDKIRKGAPSQRVERLGSFFLTKIGAKRVLCFKSELHLNQDGMRTGPGTATLPVADLWKQLIAEVRPKLVITVGTAGATFVDHELGDVMVTRGAKYRLQKEFRNELFKDASYKCEFDIPITHMETAEKLIAQHAHELIEPEFGPPSKRYPFPAKLIVPPQNHPDVKIDGRDMNAFHPILTTDYFEFGTTTNKLETQGCGVEMGDAVLGMVAKELGAAAPRWLVIRNASDPVINGELPLEPVNMQAHWAVWYYENYGYWTSVNSAIAAWAVIAGDLA